MSNKEQTVNRNRRRKRRRSALPFDPSGLLQLISRIRVPDLIRHADPRKIAGGIGLIALLIVLVTCVRSCGVNHSSPKGVVKSLILAYGKDNQKKIKDCYGQKKNTEDSLQAEIDAKLAYLDAHRPKEVKVASCDILSEKNEISYTYVIYDLLLENGQEYPCIDTYMVEKTEKGKYYILPPSEVTENLTARAAEDYARFMTTDIYKEYVKEYNTFAKKNPGYESKITTKLET